MGELNPWRSVLPPLDDEGGAFVAGGGETAVSVPAPQLRMAREPRQNARVAACAGRCFHHWARHSRRGRRSARSKAPAPAMISQNRNRGPSMPDLGALLWPRTVALIGASADAESLRGRILRVMQRPRLCKGSSIPSAAAAPRCWVSGPTLAVPTCPSLADLAVIIIPAEHVPEELERCGKAGVRSAVVLSSGVCRGDRGRGRGCGGRRSAPSRSATTWPSWAPTRRASPTPRRRCARPSARPWRRARAPLLPGAGRPRGRSSR